MDSNTVPLRDSSSVVRARQVARAMAMELGFGSADQTRVATAVSEIARNAIQYGGGGVCVVTREPDSEAHELRVTVEDDGPGIADLDQAMMRGFSTGKGLGVGLSSARMLVTDFDIRSEPGHTVVVLVLRRRRT